MRFSDVEMRVRVFLGMYDSVESDMGNAQVEVMAATDSSVATFDLLYKTSEAKVFNPPKIGFISALSDRSWTKLDQPFCSYSTARAQNHLTGGRGLLRHSENAEMMTQDFAREVVHLKSYHRKKTEWKSDERLRRKMPLDLYHP